MLYFLLAAITSFSYERVCFLFNLSAFQSQVAAVQNQESDEGLKLAAKLLQLSAAIFSYLKANVMGAIQQEPTPDLNPETLGALSSLMLAQAQEIFVLKVQH
jgi:programmed cell death 6-interacting protein